MYIADDLSDTSKVDSSQAWLAPPNNGSLYVMTLVQGGGGGREGKGRGWWAWRSNFKVLDLGSQNPAMCVEDKRESTSRHSLSGFGHGIRVRLVTWAVCRSCFTYRWGSRLASM